MAPFTAVDFRVGAHLFLHLGTIAKPTLEVSRADLALFASLIARAHAWEPALYQRPVLKRADQIRVRGNAWGKDWILGNQS